MSGPKKIFKPICARASYVQLVIVHLGFQNVGIYLMKSRKNLDIPNRCNFFFQEDKHSFMPRNLSLAQIWNLIASI